LPRKWGTVGGETCGAARARAGFTPNYNLSVGVPAVHILLAGLQGQPPLHLRLLVLMGARRCLTAIIVLVPSLI